MPDRVSNPGPLTHESGALPIALRGPATAPRGLLLVSLSLCLCLSVCLSLSLWTRMENKTTKLKKEVECQLKINRKNETGKREEK